MAAMASSVLCQDKAHWRRNWNGKCHGFRLLTNTMFWSRLCHVTPVRVPEDVVCRSCLLDGEKSADKMSYISIITTRTTCFNSCYNSTIVHDAIASGSCQWRRLVGDQVAQVQRWPWVLTSKSNVRACCSLEGTGLGKVMVSRC